MTTRLVCLPYAGGNATIYAGWRGHLGDGVELVTVEYPGHDRLSTSAPLRDMDSIVAAAMSAVGSVPAQDCVLLGHSMGAVVAFEMARRMDGGRGPRALIVSACTPAQLIRNDPRPMSDADALAYLREQNQVPEELLADEEFMAMYLPAFSADVEALTRWTYRSDGPLSCPVMALAGSRDTEPVGRMLQWRAQTTGPFSLRVFDGDHFFFRNDPAATVSVVLDLIHGTAMRKDTSRR